MRAYLLVAFGGAVGSVARYWISGLVASRLGKLFPWNTLVVNVTGSFIIGVIAVLAGSEGRLHPQARAVAIQLIMIGLCGGYTTFSSFSLQTLNLLHEGQWFYAVGNVLLSVLLCMTGVWLGWGVGQWINR
jgi:fluoride exporter